jgi:hypothetical protein
MEDILLRASKLDSLEAIRNELRGSYDRLVTMYENELLERDQDYRSGEDTYGYSSTESIQSNLAYISDRWRVGFRVRWLIELINPDYILYDS